MTLPESTTAIQPGVLILYRDGQKYNVAKVEIVRERDVTATPYDREKRQYQRGRKRIKSFQIAGQLPPGAHPQVISKRLNAVMNRHMAMRRRANAWLEECVGELVGETA